MAAPAKRVVAWYNKQEFESVYQELYSGDSFQQRHALDRICIWKCRLLHRLSTAIECTWQLITAQLQDRETEGSTHKDQEIRMSYSIALVRFVNLLTEKGQTKMYAKPVHVLAEELGLPEWLVDLRHEATHSSLPSLTILRTAAAVALQWLKREYWETQMCADNGSEEEVAGVEYQEDVSRIISDFVHAQFKVLQDEVEAVSQKQSKEQVRQVLNDLEKAMAQEREKIFQCLTEPGRMVPNTQQMEVLLISESELMPSGETLTVPDSMVQFWRPVLRLFHHLHITPHLLVHLMKEVSEEGSFRDMVLMGWTSAMLESLSTNDEKRKRVRPQLYTTPCEVDGKLLVEMSLKSPNKFTQKLLKCIFRLCPESFTLEQQAQLITLVQCYTEQNGVDSEGSPVHNAYTVESLCGPDTKLRQPDGDGAITEMETFVKDKVSGDRISQSPWQLATDEVDWSTFPLGMCPSREQGYDRLELPSSVDKLQLEACPPVAESSRGSNENKRSANELCDGEDGSGHTGSVSLGKWSKMDISLIQRHVSLL